MKTIWYGTASIGIEADGRRILLDPYFNRNKNLPCATLDDFTAYDYILLTHGHFDHVADVPHVLERGKAIVYCTKTPAKYLIKHGVSADRIRIIAPGTTVEVNGFKIDIYQSKHVVFDMGTIANRAASRDFYKQFSTAFKIMISAVTVPEAGEIVAFHIHYADDDTFVLGSLNYDKKVDYPKNVGTLVVPFIGLTDAKLASAALAAVEKFAPRRVLVDHYDDSFPPISKYTGIEELSALMAKRFPDIPVDKMEFKVIK